MNKQSFTIPEDVSHVTKSLESAGFEAFLVGGCVRDIILGKTPKDWDVTTNATPEQIQVVFPDSFYENSFGTVGVKTESENPTLKVIEVTPYRLENAYSDHRHPDTVAFSDNILEDLKRRDFTVNAIALSSESIIDPFSGEDDIKKGVLKAVGDPVQRFTEDALRILRAIRLSAELGFTIESETLVAITKTSNLLEFISKERIRDEFTKIIMSPNPMIAMGLIQKLGILKYISPELEETVGVSQNKEAHKYDVWEHLLRALQHSADKDFPLEIRLAALFHDISKPQTKRQDGNKTTFFGHEVVGARVTRETLNRLRFSKEIVEKVSKLVRWHMFFADPDQITLSAVRRIITKVGQENIWDLINVRRADRIGTGRPKEQPYRFRKYKSMIDEALRAPLSVGMLKIDGNTLISKLNINPGPKIGYILHTLFEEVLDDPTKNTEEYLLNRTSEIKDLPVTELKKMGEKGKSRLEEEDDKEIALIKDKHNVK